jgi:hypothetical protein
MVNQGELEICRRRSHDLALTYEGRWTQCRWCGLWVRDVHTREEREDEPPKDEQSMFVKVKK